MTATAAVTASTTPASMSQPGRADGPGPRRARMGRPTIANEEETTRASLDPRGWWRRARGHRRLAAWLLLGAALAASTPAYHSPRDCDACFWVFALVVAGLVLLLLSGAIFLVEAVLGRRL